MKDSGRSNKFLWVGNTPVLDFVNTLVKHDGPEEDLLGSADDFTLWLREAGLAASSGAFAGLSPESLNEAVEAARDYRALLRKSLADEGFRPTGLSTLVDRTNQLLATPTRVSSVVPGPSKTYALSATWTYGNAEDLLRPVAQSFAELLTSADHRRIRKCRNPECILYFYDTSKSGTRAWCSLDICGNKLRVAAFRQRQTRTEASQG